MFNLYNFCFTENSLNSTTKKSEIFRHKTKFLWGKSDQFGLMTILSEKAKNDLIYQLRKNPPRKNFASSKNGRDHYATALI